MPKITFEADMDDRYLHHEDGGCAYIWEPEFEIDGEEPADADAGTMVKFWSWDDAKEHRSFKRFVGKRVRITVEVVSILDQVVEALEEAE